MATDRVEAVVKRVLHEQRRLVPNSMTETLDLDSLTVVALVDALERELGIVFRGADVTAERFSSVESLRALCQERMP